MEDYMVAHSKRVVDVLEVAGVAEVFVWVIGLALGTVP